MGETVDALVVGESPKILRLSSHATSMTLIKPAIMDPVSVEAVYRPLYARSWMIGTQPRQTMSQSKRS
jgi:hypothetical protein